MTSAYILIAAVLILGGLIAALGDRLGTKVGKARLRLFQFRPRQTAIFVTVITGTLIAASTLGILFTLSESLRKGVFELDDILKKRRAVQAELKKVNEEKEQVEKELKEAKKLNKLKFKNYLKSINEKFQKAQAQLKTISNQATELRSEVTTLVNERQQLLQQREQLTQQITQFQAQVTQLKTQVQAQAQELANQEQALNRQSQKVAIQEQSLKQRQLRLQQLEQQQKVLQAQINQRDDLILQLDTTIAQKDQDIKGRENQLTSLESQLAFLQREVEILEEYYQTYQELRERQIAIVRGQVLSFAAVRVIEPNAAIGAIDQLLTQANRYAIEAVREGNGVGAASRREANSDERVVKITKAQVQQLISQIQDGRDYVVRILSAGNYVQGESEIRVFADVALNQEIFSQGDVIATVSLDASNQTEEDLQKRLDLLLSASQFRARRAGVLGNIQVEDGRIKTLFDFIEQLNQTQEPIDEIKAVVSETAYTVGPLKLHLVALRNGTEIFRT